MSHTITTVLTVPLAAAIGAAGLAIAGLAGCSGDDSAAPSVTSATTGSASAATSPAGGSATSSGGSPSTSATASTGTSSSTTSPSSSTSTSGSPAGREIVTQRWSAFATPSGNITCVLFDAGGVRCEVADPQWTPKDADRYECELELNDTLMISKGKAELGCVGDTIADAALMGPPETAWRDQIPGATGDKAVLPYGSSLTYKDLTCTSAASGVTCAQAGASFTVSKQGYSITNR